MSLGPADDVQTVEIWPQPLTEFQEIQLFQRLWLRQSGGKPRQRRSQLLVAVLISRQEHHRMTLALACH